MRRSQASRPEAAPDTRVRKAKREGKPESLARIPHDPVNEQFLIAAAALDAQARRKLLAIVPPDSFFAKGHPELWRAFGELEARGLAYDSATLRQLGGDDVDANYVDALVDAARARYDGGVPSNLLHHVECLRWDRSRIEVSRGPLQDLLALLRETDSDPEEVRSRARAVADAFSLGGSLLRDSGQVVREQAARLKARRGGVACYPYGLDGLDVYTDGPSAGRPRMIPGAAPGKTTCVTGLSGSGKSTVVSLIVLAQANAGRRVLWGAWEEGDGDSLEQLAVISLGLSREAFQTGAFGPEEERAVVEEMERLGEHVRFFALPTYQRGKKREGALNDRMLDLIHEHVVVSGCKVFVADLWRRVVRQFDPDEEEVALYRQQDIAQKTGVHCLLVHQQRLKDIERGPGDKRPTREGLKGSGTWVEVPDTILGVHRPALWRNVPDEVLEVLVLKQRKAPWPLAVEFDWEPDRARVENGRSVEFKREQAERGGVDEFLAEEARERRATKGRR